MKIENPHVDAIDVVQEVYIDVLKISIWDFTLGTWAPSISVCKPPGSNHASRDHCSS